MAGEFGSSAGEVIAEVLVRARAEGTSRIGEEHLFAALLASPDSGPLLGRLGDPERAEAGQAVYSDPPALGRNLPCGLGTPPTSEPDDLVSR